MYMHSNLIEHFSFVEDSMLHISEFAMHHHGFIDLTVVVELTLTPRVKLVQLCMYNCVIGTIVILYSMSWTSLITYYYY